MIKINIIELLKKLTQEQDETILNYLINKSCTSIKNYLKEDLPKEIIITKYEDALIQAVVEYHSDYKNNLQYAGVKRVSQGQRSIEFAEVEKDSLSSDVKALLPRPKNKIKLL